MARYTQTPEHTYEFVNETYVTTGWKDSGRKVFALDRLTSEQVFCAMCRMEIKKDPFIGVQYTYDHSEYTPLCVSCSVEREIIKPWPPVKEPETAEEPEPMAEEEKKRRGRPPGSKNKPKPAEIIPEEIELEGTETTMSLADLKAKMSKSTTAAAPKAAAAPATATSMKDLLKKKTAKPAEAPAPEPPAEDDDELQFADDVESEVENEAPATPDGLRAKVDAVDAKKTTVSGATKADVADVVRMCLAEYSKEADDKLKKLKKEILDKVSERVDAITETLKPMAGAKAEILETVGGVAETLNALIAALSGDEEEATEEEAAEEEEAVEEEEEAPAPEPPARKARVTPAAPAPAAPAPPVVEKVPFPEFIAEMAGDDGIAITVLGDMAVEKGYFANPPADKTTRDNSLVNLIKKKFGALFTVKDGSVFVKE